MKLTVTHLQSYLPHNLVCLVNNHYATLSGLYTDGEVVFFDLVESQHGFQSIKPLLRPLSEYQDINSPAMQELNEDLGTLIHINELANRETLLSSIPYYVAQVCFENHIDVFNLINHDLALSITEERKKHERLDKTS